MCGGVMSRLLVLILTVCLSYTSVASADVTPSVNQDVVTLLSKQNPFTNKLYDASFKRWAAIYTPMYPWYWNKAQAIAESGLNPNATSPVGAMGLTQFMPGTWKDVSRTLSLNGSAYTPALNIQAQAYYMSYLMNQFKKPRPLYDQYSLALASYNAGIGNIINAQRIGGNSLLYSPMSKALPQVTGKHSIETTTYVRRIWDYIGILTQLEEPKQ